MQDEGETVREFNDGGMIVDYTKLASVINGAVREQVDAISPHIRLGIVKSVSDATASVLVDGSHSPSTMARACLCEAGDRVVILRQGTQFYAIGRIGG